MMRADGPVPTAPRWGKFFDSATPWLLAACVTGAVEFALDTARARLGVHAPVSPSWAAESTLAAGHLTAAAAALVLGFVVLVLGRGVSRRLANPRLRLIVLASITTAFLAFPMWRAGVRLASGAWIAEQSFVALVRFGPLVGTWLAALLLSAILSRPPSGTRSSRWVTAFLLGAAVLLLAVDIGIAPGRFPEFHMIVHGTRVVAWLAAFGRVLSGRPRPLRHRGALALLVAFALACAMPAWFLASHRTRAELVLYSPVARDWIRTAMPYRRTTYLRTALEELDVSAAPVEAAAPQRSSSDAFPGAKDMNVLFVVVDTLRADALPPVRDPHGLPFAENGDTPFLDEWLPSTFRFSRCYSAATMTHRSMPTMFRSIQPFEDPINAGEALGFRVEELGLLPLAVVVEYFLASKYPAATALLVGFDEVAVYEKKDAATIVPSTRELLSQASGNRFFAWIHLYNMHDPGFDGELLSSRDGSRTERYRRSLRWLDHEMQALLATLDELGLRENTIVVVASDHGEGLGEHGQWLHGPTLFEHDVHVPLVIDIPGTRGGVIDEVVGNIDIVPTLMELLGAEPEPTDRGRSVVPAIARAEGVEATPESGADATLYYFQNSQGTSAGVVVGWDKLVMETDAELAYRFDLQEDPEERRNLFEPDDPRDKTLVRRLIELNPALVGDELDEPETQELLASRLEEVDPSAPGDSLVFLLRVAALRPTERTLDAAIGIFRESRESSVKLTVLREAFRSRPQRFEPLVAKWIQQLSRTPSELEVIAALAKQAQPSVAGPKVVERMKHWARSGGPETWEPYLQLVRPWKKSARYFADPFTTMIERARTEPVPTRILELLLSNISHLKFAKRDDRGALTSACLEQARHADARLRTAALRALGNLGSPEAVPLVAAKLADSSEDPRVRREAASALALMQGEDAVAPLIDVADDPALSMIVVRRLGAIRSSEALPFLREVQENHYNKFLRKAAKKAIADIERARRP